MNSTPATVIANEIIQLYEQYGGSAYAGEKVTQLEHMVQAARLIPSPPPGMECIQSLPMEKVICLYHPNQGYIYSTGWEGPVFGLAEEIVGAL